MTTKTTPVAVRLPNATLARLEQWASRMHMERADLIKRILIEYALAVADGPEYPLRAWARSDAARLREQGIKTIIAGGRGHWRIITVAERRQAGQVANIDIDISEDKTSPPAELA